MKRFILLLLISIPFFVTSQNISCKELLNYVESDGHLVLSNNAPILSEWLGNVKAYSMVKEDPSLYKVADMIKHYDSDGVYAIIAEIYSDDILRTKRKYIFCGVPIKNWNTFNSSLYLYFSRGEMFHKYIMNYRCNCY